MNKKVITIGREFGSGGREIGIKLSKRLSIPFYDKELLKLTSEEGPFDEKFLAANEEKAPVLGAPSLGRIALSSFYQPSLSDTIFLEQSKVIKEIAKRGPCVIVGRCADYVLKDEGSLDIFICASMPYKIARKRAVAPEKKTFSDEEMEKYIRDADKQRVKYYEHYTGRNWGRVDNYHLCLFADRVGPDGAVETIITYLEHWK
ncbi:MAG: cytidylate kinase-like family protein [Clostridia bacterium]|nr:cytidylate kinase-like family protein [Clostridia bacterium]